MADRKSQAEVPTLIVDPMELATKEAQNALDQFDQAMVEVDRWIVEKQPKLKISTLLQLHRWAMSGIDPYAGNFRPASVAIVGSAHKPIAGEDVPRHVEEMLEYLEENWEDRTAIHLAAYAMWRLNWIHPFADGNGRTSRMLSYMILCGRLEQNLPGTKTIPEQISENKQPYYDALEAADANYKRGNVNVLAMEKLLEQYLANQLVSIHEQATGNNLTNSKPPDTKTPKGIVSFIESKPVLISGLIAIGLAILTYLGG